MSANASLGSDSELQQRPHMTDQILTNSGSNESPASLNEHELAEQLPQTKEQIEDRINHFIDSIDENAVCRLASRHNNERLCEVVGQNSGSFNVCFFVHFNDTDTTWVVRVPLEPVVREAWNKIQNEVATLRYLCRKTTIPVPHVRAYGRGAKLSKGEAATTQAYLILSYVPGRPLDLGALIDSDEDQREGLLGQLVDILAQLRKLEFPTAGSLMPNPSLDSEPVVGRLLSMPASELQLYTDHQEDSGPFDSSKRFADYQYRILSETYSLPTPNLSRKQLEMELFALESLAEQIPKISNPSGTDGPFVLSHMDLRCGNILVTEHFQINGIIDWEFSGAVPPQFFTPPPWITGHDLTAVAGLEHDRIQSEFYEILRTKSTTSDSCAQLLEEWNHRHQLTLPIAQILRCPSTLIRVYYKFLFPQLFQGHRDEIVPSYFRRQCTSSSKLALAVERRMENSEHYTQHLKDHGLLVDNQSQKNQELLAKIQQALDKYKAE